MTPLDISSGVGYINPVINDEYVDVYGLMYAVNVDGIHHADLSDAAEKIVKAVKG